MANRLAAHVQRLAGDIGERHLWRPAALDWAARYVENAFEETGRPASAHRFDVGGQPVRNVELEMSGSARPREIVVLGAHYDTVVGCPGANDNATGVAALLEIARAFATAPPAATVRLVAFVNEEPPFFQTDDMGSRRYARRCRARGERVAAMLSLETIGCYSDAPGSQRYPGPLRLFYPDRGDFIAFVANVASRRLLRRCAASFRRHSAMACEAGALPSWIPGVGWSDQWSFWQEGYPALMVTDTAPFRYPHYHTPYDTPDKIDYVRMAQVVSGLTAVVADLLSS